VRQPCAGENIRSVYRRSINVLRRRNSLRRASLADLCSLSNYGAYPREDDISNINITLRASIFSARIGAIWRRSTPLITRARCIRHRYDVTVGT